MSRARAAGAQRRPRTDGERGAMLIEAMAALTLLLILAAGLMSVGGVALKTTENQGDLAARTTEYAQDKMEQLLALAYGDTTSDTRVFPATSSGGTGLAVGGSTNAQAPVTGYVDYLDASGNLLPSGGGAPSTWFFERVWQVTTPSTNLKQVSVTATVRWGFAGAVAPASTVVALKTSPF